MTRAGAGPVPAGDIAMAFYGDLFRPPGELLKDRASPRVVQHISPGAR
ncbi:MAG: hypothetical protein ACRDRX_06890 [Pseudonocardiaceae bacterium]